MENEFLKEDTCGGVVIYAHNGRIVVANTLAERLDLAYENLLP